MIRVLIAGLVKAEQHGVVVLLDETGRRALLIWAGISESWWAIDLSLRDYPLRRPLTFNFMADLLEAAGAELKEVCVASRGISARDGKSCRDVEIPRLPSVARNDASKRA